jgi:hypothetical protein
MMPLAMSRPPAGQPPVNPPQRGWLHLATIDITPLRRHRDFRILLVGRLVSAAFRRYDERNPTRPR